MKPPTTEELEIIKQVWTKINGDPKLLDGLLFGELDDFLAAVIPLVDFGQVPVHLARRVFQGDLSTIQVIELSMELVRLPHVREMLDGMTV